MNKQRLLIYPMVACMAAVLSFPAWTGTALAQNQEASQSNRMQTVQEVQKKLRGISDFDVFDWITFKLQGGTLVLDGYASRSILKSEAQNVMKGVPGITAVENHIKVLPYQGTDDRIRRAAYDSIYTTAPLRIYNANQGRLRGGPGMTGGPGGITNNPPFGFHAIHIIVDNGNVTLYGVVNNSGDSVLATNAVNRIPGVFKVTNDLVVASHK